MSNKVKCLFGKHDIHRLTEKESGIEGGEWRCSICDLSFTVYDGHDRLGTFALENGPDFSQHPYFYEMPNESILISNVLLSDEERLTLSNWLEEYWEEEDKKNTAETGIQQA